jgi:hypothetical protein
MKCARIFGPDRIIWLGDAGDFYCTSRHPKDPRRNRDLRFEVDSCNAKFDEVQTIGAKKTHFILGNHCDNLRRYLEEKAPELFGMMSVPDLFRFKERNWTWTEYGGLYKLGKIYVTHDQNYAGALAHVQTRNAIGHSVVMGHTHRISMSYASTLAGDHHVGAMFGWLGNAEAAGYAKPSVKKDWAHGFGVGYMDKAGTVHLQAVPFIKNTAVIEGQLVTL